MLKIDIMKEDEKVHYDTYTDALINQMAGLIEEPRAITALKNIDQLIDDSLGSDVTEITFSKIVNKAFNVNMEYNRQYLNTKAVLAYINYFNDLTTNAELIYNNKKSYINSLANILIEFMNDRDEFGEHEKYLANTSINFNNPLKEEADKNLAEAISLIYAHLGYAPTILFIRVVSEILGE